MHPERPAKHRDALTRVVDGEAMVLVQRPEVVTIVLNGVATRVWELVDGEHGVGEIARCISSEYEVSLEDAERDVHEVLEDMSEKGMLEPEETS